MTIAPKGKTQEPAIVADPSASAPSISSVPERKTIFAAISGIVTAGIMGLLKYYLGDALPPGIEPLVTALVMGAIAYFVPNTQREVANMTTNATVTLATLDHDNKTTAEIVPEERADQIIRKAMVMGTMPADLARKVEP